MREQIDIIVQFAEMLKPLRIVFIEYVSRNSITFLFSSLYDFINFNIKNSIKTQFELSIN